MIAHVTLRIFSGRPDPEWTMSEVDARVLRQRLLELPVVRQPPVPGKARLGYQGFAVSFVQGCEPPHTLEVFDGLVYDSSMRVFRVDAGRSVEQLIYAKATPVVLTELDNMSFAALSLPDNEQPIAGLKPPDTKKKGCGNGPSLPRSKKWKKFRQSNNCYNYANDVLNTNTFSPGAMPGAMTALPATLTAAQAKARLRQAIKQDGLLRYVGDKVPSICPPKNKHYVVVIIRHLPGSPNVRDFHCLRLDKNGTWSHKSNVGLPRNRDDGGPNPKKGRVIRDLTKAVFTGSPELVGVYKAKKNNRKIK